MKRPSALLILITPLLLACGGEDLPPGNGTIIHQRSVPILPILNPPRPNPPLNLQTAYLSVLQPPMIDGIIAPNRPVSIQTPAVTQLPNRPVRNPALANPARPNPPVNIVTVAPNPALPNPARPNPGWTPSATQRNVLPGLDGVMPDSDDDEEL